MRTVKNIETSKKRELNFTQKITGKKLIPELRKEKRKTLSLPHKCRFDLCFADIYLAGLIK